MPNRSEIKGIVNDIILSLNSRNNDYLGYWATGQLYKMAQENNTKKVTVNLLNKTINPYNKYFIGILDVYTEKFNKNINPRNIIIESFKEVTIEYNFEQELNKKIHKYIGTGKPYTIKLSVETEFGGTYSRTVGGYCQPHNPNKESRRNGF